MKKTQFFGLLILLFTSHVFAFTEVVNPNELRLRLGYLNPSKEISDVKVAILDNGFAGFKPGKGMLPGSAELIEGPLKLPSVSSHGLGMAQILWAMTGQKAHGPKIYLVNSNGFTNFKAAIDFVINNQIDIVLYSQVWLFGSNFDGKGFINEAVNKATSKGIIWVNAAGNLGDHVYTGPVENFARVLRFANKIDENNFSVTLSWNDFGNNEGDCTKKDLDLEILDSQNRLIQTSKLVQRGEAPDPNDPEDLRSCYARESINIQALERGSFKIRVVPKSSNFTRVDNLKVIISDNRPGSIDFLDRTENFEILPPAENPNVITVGDKSGFSALGPTVDGRVKPDFLIDNSKVAFTNGNLTQGSSNAAAMVAGAVAVMKSLKKDLNTKSLLTYSSTLRMAFVIPSGLITPQQTPSWLQNILPSGSVVRIHPVTGRAIVFTKEDPLSLSFIAPFNLRLFQNDDIIACTEFLSSCGLYPYAQDGSIRPPLIEFKKFLGVRMSTAPGVFKNIDSMLDKI